MSDWGLSAEISAPMVQRLGRYELLLPIASGGVATVYLACASGAGGFERDVALKLTHAHLDDSPEFFTALVDEARLAGRIHHPNVVSVLDVGLARRGAFIVMDYVEGDSLAVVQQILKHRGERMPLPVALRILDHVAAGLHAAHELRDEAGKSLSVVHRDVTPHNILVGTDGVSRITDFGIAKAQSRLTLTSPGMVKGKVAYMSPEQAQGRPVDRTCDVWALGVVAWELFTGTRLYDGINDPVLMLKVAREPPMRARHVYANLPRELDDVVAHALSMSPKARHQSTEDFARALQDAAREAQVVRADAREVRDFVQSLMGPRLEARREKAAKVRALRQQFLDPDSTARLPTAESPTAVIVPITSERVAATEELAEELEPPEKAAVDLETAPAPSGFRHLRAWGWRLITARLTSRAWLPASLLPALVVSLIWLATGGSHSQDDSPPKAAPARPSAADRAQHTPAREPTFDAAPSVESSPVITPQDLELERGDGGRKPNDRR